MSLDVYLYEGPEEPTTCEKCDHTDTEREVYEANTTHNLSQMAEEAGLYWVLWRPEEIQCTHAKHLVERLNNGLIHLAANPDKYKAWNPSNGWGSYESLVNFVEKYLEACELHPEARVKVSR